MNHSLLDCFTAFIILIYFNKVDVLCGWKLQFTDSTDGISKWDECGPGEEEFFNITEVKVLTTSQSGKSCVCHIRKSNFTILIQNIFKDQDLKNAYLIGQEHMKLTLEYDENYFITLTIDDMNYKAKVATSSSMKTDCLSFDVRCGKEFFARPYTFIPQICEITALTTTPTTNTTSTTNTTQPLKTSFNGSNKKFSNLPENTEAMETSPSNSNENSSKMKIVTAQRMSQNNGNLAGIIGGVLVVVIIIIITVVVIIILYKKGTIDRWLKKSRTRKDKHSNNDENQSCDIIEPYGVVNYPNLSNDNFPNHEISPYGSTAANNHTGNQDTSIMQDEISPYGTTTQDIPKGIIDPTLHYADINVDILVPKPKDSPYEISQGLKGDIQYADLELHVKDDMTNRPNPAETSGNNDLPIYAQVVKRERQTMKN